MMALIKEFWREEDGLQTVELVLILVVLVGLVAALQSQITGWLNEAMTKASDLIDKIN
jgi:Flp pilus assembly pilin Flp